MTVRITAATTPDQMQQVRALRHEVFVIGQNCPEELEWEYEEESRHFLAMDGEVPVGCARWRETEKGIKLERFAVIDAYRGKGIATLLLKHLLELHKNSSKKIYLHAQCYVSELYARQGFQPEGPIFDEAGIDHVKMVYKR